MTHAQAAMSTETRSFDQLRHEPRTLLGPGPSNIHPRVFQAMTCPILGYLDPDFLVIMDETMALLRHLFQTENEMAITLPGSGMAGGGQGRCQLPNLFL